MFTRWKFQIALIAIVTILTALAVAIANDPVVYAQEDDNGYVDVGLELEVPPDHLGDGTRHDLIIAAVNHGSRTAYDVEVVVKIEYPDLSHFDVAPAVPAGIASLSGDERTLRWYIPSLGGLQREEVTAKVTHRNETSSLGDVFDYRAYPHEHFGTVSTSSFENDIHQGNNTARVWSYALHAGNDLFNQAAGSYSVVVSVDNPAPSPGDTVEFKIEADRENPFLGVFAGHRAPPIDLKVAVELTGGLVVEEKPSATPPKEITYSPASVSSLSYENGVFNVGTLTAGQGLVGQVLAFSVTLPITVSDKAPLNQQCLTATLTGNPPPGTGRYDDDISDNVAKFCLGVPSQKKVYQSGTVGSPTIHACRSGVPTGGCDTAGEVDIQIATSTDDPSKLDLTPAVIQIKDEPGRVFDADNGSVTDGTTVSWQTATDEDPDFTGTRNGVKIAWERSPLNDYAANWQHFNVTYTASGLNGGAPPGLVSIRSSSSGSAFWALTPQNSWTFKRGTNYNLTSTTTVRMVEFAKLGTYVLAFTADFLHQTIDEDGDSNPDVFSGTGRTFFHVGPIAELGVSDGGPSSGASSNRVAFAVTGVNNRNEVAKSGKIVVQLPPGATALETVPPNTGTFNPNSSPPTWSWNINALEHSARRRAQGFAEGETVMLIVRGVNAGETATAKIVYDPYLVCIGSDGSTLAHTTQAACEAVSGASWHEGTVYDYNDDNNTATITARGGGAAGAAGGPMAPRFANQPVLTWEAVAHVNNWPVDRYQVQYLSGNDWVNLAEVPGDQTHYADTGAGSRRSYRVRALNEAGVPGFWSRSASQVTYRQASPPLNVTAEAGGAGEVVVSWEPSSDDGGSPITYYQAQWSRTGTGGWSNACRSDSASQHTCTNTGIPSGETRYYRVAAYAGGLGAWSDLAVATAVAGVPEAPSLSASRATSGSGDNILRAIRLTWSQPRDNGSTIYAYEIDYVDYDQVARKCGTDWEPLDGIGYRYSDSPVAREYLDAGNFGDGLEPGAYRCYRVRAVNSAGAGAWSNAASASAGGAVTPDQWLYLDGEADGQNAITLYWGEPHYDGGAPVTGYQLQYSDDTTNSNGELNWRNLTTTSASARSYTHTGRKVGETWHYRVRARNSAGWGGWSYPVTVTIEEGKTANLSQPSLTVQARTSKEVLLSWSSLCNPNREGDCEGKGVDGYMVEYSDDGGLYGWERLTWLWTDQTKVLDATVEPGATRYYRVAGYKEENRRQLLGRWSQIKKATTGDFRVGAPQNFTIEKEGERGLRLVWDEVTEGRDAASITGYRIERSTWSGDGPGDFDTSWVARQTNRKGSPYVETGLTPNTQYYYQVAAVTRNGAVPYIGPYSMASIFIPPAGN